MEKGLELNQANGWVGVIIGGSWAAGGAVWASLGWSWTVLQVKTYILLRGSGAVRGRRNVERPT